MMDTLEVGQNIQYRLFDKQAKEHWFPGVIHGVKSYEEKNFVVNVTYLVDTGRDARIDEYPFNHRDREVNKRVNELIAKKSKHHVVALNEVLKHSDLPDDKLDVERVRQPEQIELPREHIRII
jgi:hypothetical protein